MTQSDDDQILIQCHALASIVCFATHILGGTVCHCMHVCNNVHARRTLKQFIAIHHLKGMHMHSHINTGACISMHIISAVDMHTFDVSQSDDLILDP